MNRPFHAAYHVYDLDEARIFYRDVLGCTEGRCSATWIDFDFSAINFHCTWVRPSQLHVPAWSVSTRY